MARPKHATRVQHVAVDRAVLNHAECTNTYKSYVGYKPPQLWHKRHAVTDQPCGTHAALSNSANIYSVFTLLLPGSWMPRRVASDTVMYLLLKALFNKSKMKIKPMHTPLLLCTPVGHLRLPNLSQPITVLGNREQPPRRPPNK